MADLHQPRPEHVDLLTDMDGSLIIIIIIIIIMII